MNGVTARLVFVKFIQQFNKNRWRSIRNPKAWMCAVTQTAIIDYWRKKNNEIKMEEALKIYIRVMMDINRENQFPPEIQKEWRSTIEKMKSIHKEVAKLYYIEELKSPQIAKKLQIPEGTVRRRLAEIKKMAIKMAEPLRIELDDT